MYNRQSKKWVYGFSIFYAIVYSKPNYMYRERDRVLERETDRYRDRMREIDIETEWERER